MRALFFRPRGCLFLFLLGSLGTAALCEKTASTGETKRFVQATVDDFAEGQAVSAMVNPPGEVVPGYVHQSLDIQSAFVWTSAQSKDGKTAYFGTGDEGQIFSQAIADLPDLSKVKVEVGKIEPKKADDKADKKSDDKNPAAAKTKSAKPLLTLPEPWVTALVALPNGDLLAATTPGARIYRINPKTRAHKEIAHLQSDHIWALVHDDKSGTTYAATGGAGKIASIGSDTKAQLLWDSGDDHVVALHPAPGGGLLAGTSPSAILYRVGLDGKAFALHDFDADEVRAIAVVGSRIFVAVNDFADATAPVVVPAKTDTPKGTKVQVVASGSSPSAAGALPRPGASKANAAVYEIGANGSVEQRFALADGYFTALLADAEGNVFAASGSGGKVYRIKDRDVSVVLDVPERQILTLLAPGSGKSNAEFLLGTGDLGRVYSAAASAPGQAHYLSNVFDAQGFAQWGQMRFTAPQSLEVQTRAGNTAKPDTNWDGWRPLASSAFASGYGRGKVASAPAHYLQYKVALKPNTALSDVRISYLPQNQRARVTDLQIAGPGTSSGAGAASSDAPTAPRSSVLTLTFETDNSDNDTLIFKLAYRRQDESSWRPLGGPEPLTKPEFKWETESVPDGEYLVRVWVSDAQSVAQDRALSDTYISKPVLIDNTRPALSNLKASLPTITGEAQDAASTVEEIEFSINGGPWRPASPVDGILDEKRESFSLRVPNLPAGTHVIAVRARDEAGNIGVDRIVVKQP